MAVIQEPRPYVFGDDGTIANDRVVSVGTAAHPIAQISSADVVMTNLQIVTVNGQPYPPPSGGPLIDNVDYVKHAGDPTARIGFLSGGAAGTTSRIVFEQGATTVYDFDDPGASDATVATTNGAQTFTAAKTWSAPLFSDAVDPSVQMRITPDDNATFVFSGAASATYTVPALTGFTSAVGTTDPATITGIKTFADNAVRVYADADSTTSIVFDVNGAAGTTATLLATQAVTSTYTLTDPGVDAELLMLEGPQTISGVYSFPAANTWWYNTTTPTSRVGMAASGTAATVVTLTSAQTTDATFLFQQSTAATVDVVIDTGAQTISGTTEFSNELATNTITELTPDAGINVGDAFLVDQRVNVTPAMTYVLVEPNAAPPNIPIVFLPSGTSALSTRASNIAGTTQARGQYAVDMQQQTLINRVAAATSSAICGGTNGTIVAAATAAGVAGGVDNIGSGTGNSVVTGGNTNQALGEGSGVHGGNGNSVFGASNSVCGGGELNLVTTVGGQCAILGGSQCTISGASTAAIMGSVSSTMTADGGFMASCDSCTMTTGASADNALVASINYDMTTSQRCVSVGGFSGSQCDTCTDTVALVATPRIANSASSVIASTLWSRPADACTRSVIVGSECIGLTDTVAGFRLVIAPETYTNLTRCVVHNALADDCVDCCVLDRGWMQQSTDSFATAGCAFTLCDNVTSIGDGVSPVGAQGTVFIGHSGVGGLFPVVTPGTTYFSVFGATVIFRNNYLMTTSPVHWLENYPNDAAASAGGIQIGQLYRNEKVLMVRIT